MKNIKKKKENIDVIAEARKHPKFIEYFEQANIRNRFAIEMYQMREKQNITQQVLAKHAKTTQKVISNIEYGDVNVGFDLLNRIGRSLNFSAENWGKVFNFEISKEKVYITAPPAIVYKGVHDLKDVNELPINQTSNINL